MNTRCKELTELVATKESEGSKLREACTMLENERGALESALETAKRKAVESTKEALTKYNQLETKLRQKESALQHAVEQVSEAKESLKRQGQHFLHFSSQEKEHIAQSQGRYDELSAELEKCERELERRRESQREERQFYIGGMRRGSHGTFELKRPEALRLIFPSYF